MIEIKINGIQAECKFDCADGKILSDDISRALIALYRVVCEASNDETADKGHCLASEGNDDILSGTLAHGHFVMYVPGEPHMCNIVMPEAEVGPIKKICFKVISDQYWDEA